MKAKSYTKALSVAILATMFLIGLVSVGYADPLDDAQARLGGFLQRAGLIVTGLVPAAGILAVGVLSIRRNLAKAAGEDDAMARSSSQIMDVLKYVAIGSGASLLVAIAGSILQ